MTLVATALCADRAVASQLPRPQPDAVPARSFVGRLTVRFQRAVPAVKLVESRREKENPRQTPSLLAAQNLPGYPKLSPFQFRLPPPGPLAGLI
jgi:hypothetical protein